jgi:hypothetical protein
MSASVRPEGPDDQHSTATATLAGGGLGATGTIGNSTSTSTIDFNSGTGALSVSAASSASDVSIAGVVRIGSVSSAASAVSTDGATPKLQGRTDFHDMSVAGQAAYVDGSGVHLGTPSSPAGPAEVDAVDAALSASGMEIYFTEPHTVTVGGTAYYYAASVLFYWVVPQDPSHNSFTESLGGAAVSLSDGSNATGIPAPVFDPTPAVAATPASPAPVSAGPPMGDSGTTGGGVVPVGLAGAAAPTSPGLTPAIATAGGTSLSLPASAAAASSTAGNPTAAVTPAGVDLAGGAGAGWWVLAGLVTLAGAALTTRVPAMLDRRAAAVCPRERTNRSVVKDPKDRK